MKKYFILTMIVFSISILNLKAQDGGITTNLDDLKKILGQHANAGDIQEFWNKIASYTYCQIPIFNDIPGMTESCAKGNPDTSLDLTPIASGRLRIRNHFGCNKNFYDDRTDDNDGTKNFDKHVVLLGDSLTDFGGDEVLWNLYLGNGRYNVLVKGAAGATSSAWKDHFDTCVTRQDPFASLGPPAGDYGRPQAPPRSIMMIGGNDFHVFKGMLQAMPWAVPLRRLNTVYNIEKLITYHHQGNNGCGDYKRVIENGEVTGMKKVISNPDGTCSIEGMEAKDGKNYENWGIGRLFVLLGNLPAVSLDPTSIPGYVESLKRLGLWERPNDDIANKDNLNQAELTNDALVVSMLRSYYEAYIGNLLSTYLLDTIVEIQNCGKLSSCKDNTWVSRQMYKLQFTSHAMTIIRKGVPFIHMYSLFRDVSANNNGCWWCADKTYWMGSEYTGIHTISLKDGIHINYPNGYLRWGGIVTPFMEQLKMDQDTRLYDGVETPGGEVVIPQGCDDLCLYIICVMTGICK